MSKTNQENKTVELTSFHKANFNRRSRYLGVFVIMVFLLGVIIILNINIGSVTISPSEIFKIIFTRSGDSTNVDIIWSIRLPRMCMAAILGGGLAVAGFLLQTYFDNPIAGPFVLGISSGAKMVVAITMIFFITKYQVVSSYALIIAAFIGSLVSTSFILLIAKYVKHMASLLVAGIMIGYICSAVTDFIITFADDSDIANLHNWSMGSFSGMDWNGVRTAGLIICIGFLITFFMSKPIGAFQLGEAYAQSMGVNVKKFRIAIIVLSSLLSGCVTAYAGPISFIGIAVPYLIKRSLNTAKPLIVIPFTFAGGAIFCTACDLIARTAFAPTELMVSTVTSIFGAPIVIYMMIKKRKEM